METERYAKNCRHCGIVFETFYSTKIFCRRTCKTLYRDKHKRNSWSAGQRMLIKYEIIERDGYVCGICKEPIDPDMDYPDKYSLSVDHIIPVKHGGGDSLNNLQPAHLICNIAKGAN